MNEIQTIKDKIYKLSTGEKVSPLELEKRIGEKCHYVQYVVVGKDDKEHPVAMIFPNQKLFPNPDYQLSPEEGCFCPRSLDELGRCLSGCLKRVNQGIEHQVSKLASATIINTGLTAENTPPLSSDEIFNKYKAILQDKYGKNVPAEEEIYVIKNLQ